MDFLDKILNKLSVKQIAITLIIVSVISLVIIFGTITWLIIRANNKQEKMKETQVELREKQEYQEGLQVLQKEFETVVDNGLNFSKGTR